MAERPNHPQRLDLRRLARDAATVDGVLAQVTLPRLHEAVLPTPGDVSVVRWAAHGELRTVAGSEPEVWLHLRADTEVRLVCQRCLQVMAEALVVDRRFMFVADEDEAARLDEESEDDVLVLPRAFDLLALLEDELILALPLVPRHEVCPNPLPQPAPFATEAPAEAAPHPFAALAALRRPPKAE